MNRPEGREDELAEEWMSARQKARRRPTPENEAAAEAAFGRYREHIVRSALYTTRSLADAS